MHLSHIVSSVSIYVSIQVRLCVCERRGFALVEKIILTATQTGKQTGKQTNKPTENMKSGAKTEKIKENCSASERDGETEREREGRATFDVCAEQTLARKLAPKDT